MGDELIMQTSKIVLSMVLAIAVFVAQARADQCDAIGQYGIYDTSTSQSEDAKASSFLNWFCQSNLNSYGQASKFGLDVGIPIGDFLGDLGLNSDSSNWQTQKQNICASISNSSSSHGMAKQTVRKINPILAQALSNCVNNQEGLHLWVVPTDDPAQFILHARYKPMDQSPSTTIRSHAFSPSVSCEPTISNDEQIDSAGTTWLCKRDPKTTASLVINAKSLPHWDTPSTLPAVTTNVAAVVPPKSDKELCLDGDSAACHRAADAQMQLCGGGNMMECQRRAQCWQDREIASKQMQDVKDRLGKDSPDYTTAKTILDRMPNCEGQLGGPTAVIPQTAPRPGHGFVF